MPRSTANQQSNKPTHQRHLLAIILFIVVFISYLDRINVSILVVNETFLNDMGIVGDAVQKGLLMTLFLVAYGLGNIILSPIGDLIGPRKGMCISICLWSVSLLIGGVAPSLTLLFLSRIILGFGEGMHFPMQSKFIKAWFPPSERGKANMIWQAGMAIAPVVAMPLLTFILYHHHWRTSFFILLSIGLLPLLAVWFFTADTPRQNKKINSLEQHYIEQGLAEENDQQGSKTNVNFMARFRSFSLNYQFWLLVFYYMIHTSVVWGAMTWLPSYLKIVRGFSWTEMGFLASLPWFLGIFTRIISGLLCDKFGRRAPLILVAMIGASIGITLGAGATDHITSAICLSLGLGAIGLGGPASWTLLQDITPAKGISTAAGLMNGLGNGFSALAPIVIGFLISLTGSYTIGLYYLVACSIIGAVLALILTLKGR